MKFAEVGGVTTTEVCNLSCVMCHFNGPNSVRLENTLTVEEVRKFVSSIPTGSLWFASTGDFLMDPNAMQHLRTAVEFGHVPNVLTNGQLLTPPIIDEMLEIGVKEISISVDAIDPESYRKIRRGGELNVLLDVCAYLRSKKKDYPHLRVSIANVLFKKTLARIDDFVQFWSGKADFIKFQAECYNTLKMRNLLHDPGERVDCTMRVYLLPNGQMSPCCAITNYQHNRKLDWLPHIRNTTPDDALEYFKGLYADRDSPLGRICQECDWWIMFKQTEDGESPYTISLPLPEEPEIAFSVSDLKETAPVFDLANRIVCHVSDLSGDGPVSVTTSPMQWAFAVQFPFTQDPDHPAANTHRLVIRIDLAVEEGCVGVAVVNAEGADFVSREKLVKVADGRTVVELTLLSPRAGMSLVIRNWAKEGIASRLTVHAIGSFISASFPAPAHDESSFVPLEELVLIKSDESAVLPLTE